MKARIEDFDSLYLNGQEISDCDYNDDTNIQISIWRDDKIIDSVKYVCDDNIGNQEVSTKFADRNNL